MVNSGPSPKVFIVDDDSSFCMSLARLMKAHHIEAEVVDSAERFMDGGFHGHSGCLVLDVNMPGLNGMDMQEALVEAGCTMPIIFLTGHGDIPMSVQAMKKGAADFLTKPVDEEVLLKAVARAFAENERRNAARAQVALIQAKIRTLTVREREVMGHVISGALNKQIAGALGTVEKTIKVHRARVMEKMGADSVAELVRLCSIAGVEPTRTA